MGRPGDDEGTHKRLLDENKAVNINWTSVLLTRTKWEMRMSRTQHDKKMFMPRSEWEFATAPTRVSYKAENSEGTSEESTIKVSWTSPDDVAHVWLA